jgi:hypothetical protein
VRMADSDGNLTRWELQYAGLTDGEVQTLEELFMECEGRLQTFVFLDPFANLLRWSGDLSNPVWESSMLAAPDLEDPTGGIDAWRVTNAAQSGQTLGQSVDAPGWYRYTFSAWVRSESASALALQLGSGSGAVEMIRPVSPEWQRIAITGELGGDDTAVRCAIELPAACAVDFYGPQLEAQPDASGYRRTTKGSGVLRARFDQDRFERISYGPDNHSVRLRVVTVRGTTT